MHFRKSGFTLIELLVVIAIIGVLASIVLASLTSARAKARDSKRVADLRSMEKALNLYYSINGRYPLACGATANAWKGHGSNFGDCNTDYIEGLAPYINQLPIDPSGDTTQGYIYRSTGTEYKVMSYVKLEKLTYPQGTPLSRCDASCTAAYCFDVNSPRIIALYSPGAKCW